MAEFVDINTLNNKNTLSGNEKLQVSETEYTTTATIRDYVKNYLSNTNAFLKNSNFRYISTGTYIATVSGGDTIYFGNITSEVFTLRLNGKTFAEKDATAIIVVNSNIRRLTITDTQGGQILYHESAKNFNPTSGSLTVICIQAICQTNTPNVYGDYVYLVNAAEYSSK